MKLTLEQLQKLFPHGKILYMKILVDTDILTKFDIVTPNRITHFLAQCAAETGGLRGFDEDPLKRYPMRYEKRLDLGNILPGDGWKYRGRGAIQLTGRYNYKNYGKALGFNYELNPDLVVAPYHAWLVSGLFWKDHGLNELADKNDIYRITKRINGGLNLYETRKSWYGKISPVLGVT